MNLDWYPSDLLIRLYTVVTGYIRVASKYAVGPYLHHVQWLKSRHTRAVGIIFSSSNIQLDCML